MLKAHGIGGQGRTLEKATLRKLADVTKTEYRHAAFHHKQVLDSQPPFLHQQVLDSHPTGLISSSSLVLSSLELSDTQVYESYTRYEPSSELFDCSEMTRCPESPGAMVAGPKSL